MTLRPLFLLVALLALSGGALAQKTAKTDAKPQEALAPKEKPKTEAPSPAKKSEARQSIVVKEGESIDGFDLTNGDATVRGRVQGDVHLKDSHLVIEKNGGVDGVVVLDNSSVSASRGSVKARREDEGLVAPAVADVARIEYPRENVPVATSRPNWFAQQASIWLLALLCGGVFAYASPLATRKTTEEVAAEPARCLIVGGVAALALGMASVLNASLMNFSLRILSLAWSPFGFGASVLILGLIAFGWVCGLNYFGNFVASKIGRNDEGALWGRVALGATALLLASVALGGVLSPLAAFALLAQGLLAVLGLGSAVITGLGREQNWLGSYLSQKQRFTPRP